MRAEADPGFLAEKELETVEQMISFVCEENTAKSISQASDDHIWMAADDGEEIPHYTVFAQPGGITNEDREWAFQQLEAESA